MATLGTTVRATYSCVLWTTDEDGDLDDYPAEWGGFCDPLIPWGTADDSVPADDENAYGRGKPIELTMTLLEAAQLVADFPGAVWDYIHDCDPSENYRTGVSTQVTLHIGEHAATVFELVDTLNLV